MDRRSFLRRVAVGAVATAAVISLPASIVKSVPSLVGPASDFALKKLRVAYMAFVDKAGTPPAAMIVGRDLYECFEGELETNMRFKSMAISNPHLLFKGSPVFSFGRGYGIDVL